ncbi:MAG: LLM class flavin-dependent oxidoreductase [Planctomycetes bacterium]|nr:LLM class flavin-dependent oxidoreductase [Planctomycetota bacterium]
MDFGLFYFANHDARDGERERYRLILESARWADENGFVRLWAPERHFHSFGGLSPNPSVIAAALASTTRRIQICAGSVVLPLHDPIRVAEEWSVIDNLSNGRVGLGVACGWVPNDFVISGNQGDFDRRREVFLEKAERLQRLWRGEPYHAINPHGKEIAVQTVPRPIQSEVPLWFTVAANPESFAQAGTLGAHLLTHLLGQTQERLGERIAVYREAWKAAGHPGQGIVSLMLHTYVGEDDDEVHELVREPMKRYLGGSLNLAAAHIASVPFLKDADKIDVGALTPELVDQTLEASFEKYFHTASLLGSYEKCLDAVERFRAIGVDEVACLIDFGLDEPTVWAGLERLNVVRVLARPRARA